MGHRAPGGWGQAWVMGMSPPQPGSHTLRPRSFPSPTKCLRCASLMVGLGRQGLGCDGETPTLPAHPLPCPATALGWREWQRPWPGGSQAVSLSPGPWYLLLSISLCSVSLISLDGELVTVQGPPRPEGGWGWAAPPSLTPPAVSHFPHSLRLLLSLNLCPTGPTLPRAP